MAADLNQKKKNWKNGVSFTEMQPVGASEKQP
jgi:hypothetical protein